MTLAGAQIAGLELDDETIGAVVGTLGSAPRPLKLDGARIERQMRDLALDHAAGRLEDGVYLDRLRALRESTESLEVNTSGAVSAEVALAWLRTISSTWSDADVLQAKAEVLHAIYEQIVVTGRTIVSIRLTPSAYAHGLAVALPKKVALSRPTGVKPTSTHAGFKSIPILQPHRCLLAALSEPFCVHRL